MNTSWGSTGGETLQTSIETPTAPRPDRSSLPMGMRVANAIHKAGVSAIPRNYEIFYTAISGTDPKVEAALLKLGANMRQESLDEIYDEHFKSGESEAIAGKICNAVERKLEETLEVLRAGQQSVTQYGHVLSQAETRLAPQVNLPPAVVKKLVGLLSNATETTRKKGEEALQSLESNTNELSNMRKELEEYKRLASTDPLTGLFNRRTFDERVAALGTGKLEDIAIVVGDIDNFKSINDTYGHPFGDAVLKRAASVFQKFTRDDVFIARVGGEEFAIISANITPDGMMILSERIRTAIESTQFGLDEVQLKPGMITMSLGACHSELGSNATDLYSYADQALYASKQGGRNKVTNSADLNIAPDRKNLLLYEK